MSRIVKQFMHSRVAWVLSLVVMIWISGNLWYEALSGGFKALNTIQVVLATLLTVVFLAAFVVNRGWAKRTEEPD